MAIVKAIVTYSDPEDIDSNYIRLYSCSTKDGAYNLDGTFVYTAGTNAIEFSSIDTSKWYKIQFINSTDSTEGALSDPIYGNDFDRSKPFVAFSSTWNCVSYATPSGLYDLTNLSASDVSVNVVQSNLSAARSYIDLVLGEVKIDKFTTFYDSETSRRKYKAQMETIKNAEIYYASALIYKNLSDDKIMEDIRLGATATGIFTPPSDMTAPSDLIGSGISISNDILISGNITLIDDQAVNGVGFTSVTNSDISGIIGSVSIGQTSISIGDTSSSAVETNNDWTLKEKEFELKEKIEIFSLNNKTNLDEAAYNDSRRVTIGNYNNAKNIDIVRFNQQQILEAAQFNFDKDLRANQYNYNKNLAARDYNLKLFAFNHQRLISNAQYFNDMSNHYANLANSLIKILLPTNIPLSYNNKSNRYITNLNIYNVPSTPVTTSPTVDLVTADLTGLGDNFNGVYYNLRSVNMGNNEVDGVKELSVRPLETLDALADATLSVNGIMYYPNAYIQSSDGTTKQIDAGNTGFDMDFNSYTDSIQIKWNNIAASGGFDLAATDEINFKFWGV